MDLIQFDNDRITLKGIRGEMRSINYSQILYFKSFGNYVKMYVREEVSILQITTNYLEHQLPKQIFLRIHKSFIINTWNITSQTNNEVILGKHKIPIGKTFRRYVMEHMTHLNNK